MVSRFVFVGGLHRSGTSLAARLVARHPDVASICHSPAPENEGVYLQGGIPHTALSGRPMHFATDPAQHLIEAGPYDRLEVRDRMLADWDPWFGPGRAWRVEKSPVNMTRMRLYQQLFPMAQFIVVLRHPQAVAGAVRKWGIDDASACVDHWIEAHERLLDDLSYLHAVLVVRYEDLCADPEGFGRAIAAYLSLPPIAPPGEKIVDANGDYAGGRPLDAAQAAAVARWGYGDGLATGAMAPIVAHPLRAVREAVLRELVPPG